MKDTILIIWLIGSTVWLGVHTTTADMKREVRVAYEVSLSASIGIVMY